MIFKKHQKDAEEKGLNFTYSIKNNLSLINKNLQNQVKKYKPLDPDQFLKLEDSEIMNNKNDQQKQMEQNFTLLKELMQNWGENQTKSILIYNKLIQKSQRFQPYPNTIFVNTLFHKNLWHLMSYYLEKELKYTFIKTENSKIIDIWYQFFITENKELFSMMLSQNKIQNINLGSWFKTYCVEQLFLSFYQNDKKLYTLFIKDFFLYGWALLFYQSVNILRKKLCCFQVNSVKIQKSKKINMINHIHSNYIQKFKL